MEKFLAPKRHEGRVILVTGSTMGIGFAILKRLALEGATVILTSRRKDNVEAAENELKKLEVNYITAITNFNDKNERAKLFAFIKEKYGRLDGLVSNVAANVHFGMALDIDEKQFNKIYEVNVMNTFFTIRDAFPLLEKGTNASVLIITSQAGYTPFAGIGVYSTSKTALLGLIKLLAVEFASSNIRVNGIAPGIIRTKFASAIADSETAKSNFMGRVGNPEEIAGLAAFLISEDASYITGETIAVNGGVPGKL